MELETDRLLLRILRQTDAPRIQLLAGHALVAATTSNIPHPYPDGAAEEFIQHVQQQYKQKTGYTFAITHKDTGLLMGVIGLGFDAANLHGEMGYWIGVDYWGNGIATEAAKRVIEFAFEALAMHRVYAGCFMNNPASGRVQEKAGMQLEGIWREHYKKNGIYIDVAYRSILQQEYAQLTTKHSPE